MSMAVSRADNLYDWGSNQALVPPEILLYIDATLILDRIMSHPALGDLDTSEAGVLWRILSPIANELSTAYLQLARVIQLRSLVGQVGQRAYGPYLDEIGWQEMGVPRNDSVSARYTVAFSGPAGTIIPQGTVVATATDLEYVVVVGTVLGSDGAGGAIVECRTPGPAGNVAAGAISRILTGNLAGVSVTNEFATPLVAGSALESDADYRVRLLRYRRDPPNGTNAAQFRTWAEQVPGVGRAQVVRPAQTLEDESDPRRPTPGTIHIYVVGVPLIFPPAGPLASQAVVDAVQQWIAPAPPPVRLQVTDWMNQGSSPLDIYALLPTAAMQYAGIWSFRPAIGFTDTDPPTDPAHRVGELAAVNLTDAIDLPQSPTVGGDARRLLLAGELSAAPPQVPAGLPELMFYWDGAINNAGAPGVPGKNLRLTISQTVDDPGTLQILGGWLVGQFSDPDQLGLADVGDRVEVFAAPPIPLDVAVTVQAQPGWSEPAVQSSVRAALEDYLKGICFGGAAPPVGGQADPTANDVLYGIAQAVIIGAQGVAYIRDHSLRINGATDDIIVWVGDVATLASLECTVELAAP